MAKGRFGRRVRTVTRRVYRTASRRGNRQMQNLLGTVIGAVGYKFVVKNISSRLPINPLLSETGMAIIAPMMLKNKLVKDTANVTLAVNTLRVLDNGLGAMQSNSTGSNTTVVLY